MRNNRAMTIVPHRVAVLAIDQVVGLDLGTPSQVFGTVCFRPSARPIAWSARSSR